MKRMLGKITLLLLIGLFFTAAGASAGTGDDLIRQRIFEMYDLDTTAYEIEIRSNPLSTASLTAAELQLRPLLKKAPRGLFSFQATVTRDGKQVESRQVRTKIRKFAEVVVTIDKIKRSEEFAPDRMEIRRMEVTNLTEKPISGFDELAGLRAKRNIRQETILTLAATEPIPDIERGDETLIVYNDGLCRITVPGIALQSGVAGDHIRVKNKATKKIITARVIDDSAVAVDP